MTDALETTLKKIVKRQGRWEGPGWVIGSLGIIVIITGVLVKIPLLIQFGSVITGLGIVLVGAGKLARTEWFKK